MRAQQPEKPAGEYPRNPGRTMYRLLRTAGEYRERRRQRTHPAKKKPELMATGPNQVWSWGITELRDPTRGVNRSAPLPSPYGAYRTNGANVVYGCAHE